MNPDFCAAPKKRIYYLQWEVIDLGTGYFKIKNRTDGKVLKGGSSVDGTAVTEWTDGTSYDLQWQIIAN